MTYREIVQIFTVADESPDLLEYFFMVFVQIIICQTTHLRGTSRGCRGAPLPRDDMWLSNITGICEKNLSFVIPLWCTPF